MKIAIVIIGLAFPFTEICCQDLPPQTELQMEELSVSMDEETEDDSYMQELENFRKHPVNLNSADANELRQLRLLSEQQINNLLSYRKIFGDLIHVYEMQAVPGWDNITSRRLLPFVTVQSTSLWTDDLAERLRAGESSVLLRVSQIIEKARGFTFDTSGKHYLGSPQKVFFRYKYSYKNLFQFGFTGDKDAGEQFLKGKQKLGFDFYSFHIFIRHVKGIAALAIGDFTVNMGQGLVHWQSLAFKKGAEVTNTKRQSPVLKPYTSAGEFFFHRGAGITIRRKNIESTAFLSLRNLNANVSGENEEEGAASSLLTSGNNRTLNELADRHALRQLSFGSTTKYEGVSKKGRAYQVALNGVYYNYSLPLNKRDLPYNKYSIRSDQWYNASVDYSYTHKNIHMFGETAVDARGAIAIVHGFLLSLHSLADFSFVHRSIPARYQAVYGNAFTESSAPSNEKGFFLGISIRPLSMVRVSLYADHYIFPWLKFRVDAPSRGADYLVQMTFTPNKQLEIYTRYKTETRQTNDKGYALNVLESVTRKNWRTHFNYQITQDVTVRSRFESSWFIPQHGVPETGFVFFFDVFYKPLMKPYSVNLRLMNFESDSYDSRMYAYENDVMYSSSVPVFHGRGRRQYLNLSYDLNRKTTIWLKLSRTTHANATTIGSGLDEIVGTRKTEVKLQGRFNF